MAFYSSLGGRAFAPLKLIGAWIACLAIGVAVGSAGGVGPTRLTFLSVGQGDCTVFQTEGATVLIDDGPKSPTFDAGQKIVLPDLEKLGAESVDMILLSHPDRDHVGGTGALLKAFPHARIAMSQQFINDPHLQAELSEWGLHTGDVLWLGDSSQIRIGQFTLAIEDPPLAQGAADNDGSMFIHLVGGPASAVFSGDADASTEIRMEPTQTWTSQVLKVGHHGSRTASDPSWLALVHPTYAVVSCGLNNEYGHPAAVTLQKLDAVGARVFRTDLQSDIEFRFDAKKGFVPVHN